MKLIRRTHGKLSRIINALGHKKKCYICGRTFNSFNKYKGGWKAKSEFRKKLDSVDSDFDNFGCMYCGCHDRERHLFMFFDKLRLWEHFKNSKLLHFAPEIHLSRKIVKLEPDKYIKADLYPKPPDIKKVDATAIPFGDNTFDFVIANHVLEHIPDYCKAIFEFYRVLKSGGIAILQTPYSKLLKANFEDDGINTDELRLFFHGQEDHVITFGEHQFLDSLQSIGFELQIKKHTDFFNEKSAYYYGVSIKEDLIMVVKK